MTAQNQNHQTRPGDMPAAANPAGARVVSREIKGLNLDPVAAFEALGQVGSLTEGAAILESSLVGREGRASFIHLTPKREITVTRGQALLRVGVDEHLLSGAPLALLREEQAAGAAEYDDPLAAFTGALIGYVAYDAVRLFEDIPDRHLAPDGSDTPEILFRRYESAIGFDHHSGRIVVSSTLDADRDGEAAESTAQVRLDELERALREATSGPAEAPTREGGQNTPPTGALDVACDISDEDFYPVVEAAREYIRCGDIFQVVLSRRFEVPFQGPPFALYRAIKDVAPAPYMFYLDLGTQVVVGASPEKLVSLSDGALESCPLAGTRRRGRTPEEDQALGDELLADEKERAEHMMLVDLARNDLGAISLPGSVRVAELMAVEPYSHVMHLSSSVEGRLAPGRDAFDAIRYALPAGTLSGAPKIRAMEIIDELESSRRGIYGGAICAIDHAGNLNSCIVIRTAVIENGMASIRAGAGIVHESDPRLEALETRNKAQSVLHALACVGGRRVP